MIDMTDPRNEHIVTHPHFLKGVEHGIQQERDRIYQGLVEEYQSHADMNMDTQKAVATSTGFVQAMIIALDFVLDEDLED
jgi:predicted metal-dependent phosphoesterase TrpH